MRAGWRIDPRPDKADTPPSGDIHINILSIFSRFRFIVF